MVTMKVAEVQADNLEKSAYEMYFNHPGTPLQRTTERMLRLTLAVTAWREIASRSKWGRRKQSAMNHAERCEHVLSQERASIQNGVEYRAVRTEDREYWESIGYRVFDVWNSGTFSTSSDPMYSARCAINTEQEWLQTHGYVTMTDCPDHHYVRWRDTYWGTNMSQAHGHVVLLIRAETPMDLEMARRHYLESQQADWRERLGMEFPHCGFRTW